MARKGSSDDLQRAQQDAVKAWSAVKAAVHAYARDPSRGNAQRMQRAWMHLRKLRTASAYQVQKAAHARAGLPPDESSSRLDTMAEGPSLMLCWSDLEPGSNFRIVAENEVQLMTQAIDYARERWGMEEPSADFRRRVAKAIRKRIANPSC